MSDIRRLTGKDWPDISTILDSRSYFQGQALDPSFHANVIKQKFVLDRLNNPHAAFFGYYDDTGKLIAFRSVNTILGARFNYCTGVAYTLQGEATERAPNSNWPKVIIDLNNHTIESLMRWSMKVLWVMGPAVPPKAGRLVDDPNTLLSDRNMFSREDVAVIPAGQTTGNPLFDDSLLGGITMPKDQIVMKFTLLQPYVYKMKLPPGSPVPPSK